MDSIEPLGLIHWAEVASLFEEWALENERPTREQDYLKTQFNKMVNTKKKTGDPMCPPLVRRAKYIARNVARKVRVK